MASGGAADGDSTTVERWTPARWQEHLANIRSMRQAADAPVDTVGCHMLADRSAPAAVQRFQTLVALMLSSQTNDNTTAGAMRRLKEHGLTVSSLSATPLADIEQLIHPVGFYKRKAQYLQRSCAILQQEYGDDIPSSLEGLLKLPGVGQKMANLCMQAAWGETVGIGVDLHVHRIANRLGWVRRPTKQPNSTKEALEEWLPHELWSDINHLLVGFGQTVCAATPRCAECLNQAICPFGSKAATGRKTKAVGGETLRTADPSSSVIRQSVRSSEDGGGSNTNDNASMPRRSRRIKSSREN